MLVASILGHLSAKALAGLLAGAMVAGGSAAAATGSLPTSVQNTVSQAAGSLGIQLPSGANSHAAKGLAEAALSHHGIGKTVSAIARSGAGAYAVVSATPAGTKVATTPAAKVLAGGVGKHRPSGGTGGTGGTSGTGGTGGTGGTSGTGA